MNRFLFFDALHYLICRHRRDESVTELPCFRKKKSMAVMEAVEGAEDEDDFFFVTHRNSHGLRRDGAT